MINKNNTLLVSLPQSDDEDDQYNDNDKKEPERSIYQILLSPKKNHKDKKPL